MGWQASVSGSERTWGLTAGGITRNKELPLGTSSLVYNLPPLPPVTFSTEKTYLLRTQVNNFNYDLGSGYKQLFVRTPWGQTFTYSNTGSKLPIKNDSNVSLTFYVKPPANQRTKIPVTYTATSNGFGTSSNSVTASVIKSFDLIEFDWEGQGWSWATSSVYGTRYNGWSYNGSNNSFTYTRWKQSLVVPGDQPVRGPQDIYTSTNFIAKYVPYANFNLFFNYSESGTAGYSFLDMYLVTSLTPLRTTNLLTFTSSIESMGGQYIGRIGTGGFTYSNYEFYNLTGNQYIVINANYNVGGLLTTGGYQTVISDIIITGGYNETDNNEEFLFTNTPNYYSPTPLNVIGKSIYATYSSLTTTNQTLHYNGTDYFGSTSSPGYFSNIYGQVINLSEQVSKIGNGKFRAGIWENGVWNSGIRVDDQVYEFTDVVAAFTTTTKNYKWRIQISGPTQSVEKFDIGDKVSISNIVSININDERKLLKKYFTVILKDQNNIVVELENNFPIRRVIKDSDNHKIKITKNVWLSGAFLNGYFEGIWNNGLVKGFPYITELYNTHWIDGTFDGGHLNSDYEYFRFIDTIYSNGFVGLSVSNTTPHNFVPGELIVIEKDNPVINGQYDGTASITSVTDQYFITTDIPWGVNSQTESGFIRKFYSTSLVQNMKFYDNNVAPKNYKQSSILKDIWRYNSWMDLNFSTYSVVNINSEKEFFNNSADGVFANFQGGNYGRGFFTGPNLRGMATDDVLSSESYFRDLDSFNRKKYSLGNKYEIYQDFLGEISEFNKPFGTSASLGGLDTFFADGWTYSFSGEFSFAPPFTTPIPFTFSRTTNATLKFQGANTISVIVFDNTNINIEKKRYSIIELDVVDFGNSYNSPNSNIATLFEDPNAYDESGLNTGTPIFPDTTNPQMITTPGIKKRFYFYNRIGLDLTLFNVVGSYYEIDNIKFYEVDNIPFFSYTTEDYVNKIVALPYQARAPFIDYNNVNFSFTDNITFGFDSIAINQSSVPTTTAAITTGIAYTG